MAKIAEKYYDGVKVEVFDDCIVPPEEEKRIWENLGKLAYQSQLRRFLKEKEAGNSLTTG